MSTSGKTPEQSDGKAANSTTPRLIAAKMLGERAEMVLGRFQDPLPEGPFELIVSAFALHHVDAELKADLLPRVAERLSEGGLFVLADVIEPHTPVAEPTHIDREHSVYFSAAHAAKDSGIALELAREEGLRLPVCKLVKAGVLNEELFEIIRTNVRVSDQVVGDFEVTVKPEIVTVKPGIVTVKPGIVVGVLDVRHNRFDRRSHCLWCSRSNGCGGSSVRAAGMPR